jgi:methylenetetrahydrofolate--tRNA-(uracil-5-)-methyltransferase
MTGVEGYVESAASGLLAGMNAARMAQGLSCITLPAETTLGSLAHYITNADAKHFQPMNANFGLLPPLEERIRNKKLKNERLAERALQHIEPYVHQ